MTDTEPAEPDVTEAGFPLYDFNPGSELPVLGNAHRLDALQDRHPFFRSSAEGGFWVLTRTAEINEALRNPAVFSSSATLVTDPDPVFLWIPQMLDPPRHTEWRRLLAPYFSPANLRRLEHSVQTRCEELLDPIAEKSGCDFLAEFAQRYPTSIFMDMFGLPIEELDQFLDWEYKILHTGPDTDPDRMIAITAMFEVMGYFDQLIGRRRADPRDDIVSQSLNWTIDGEPIPHADLLSFCLLMFLAGLDTVTIQLGYTFWHLATHDEHRRRIVAEPELIPSAVEELLRLYSFVPPSRKIMRDIDFHGCPMKAGEIVYINTSAACRDPLAFPDARQAVLDRSPNQHLAFGSGPHRCVGAALAQRELRVAVREWHRRIPDYRIPEGFEVRENGVMHGIKSLHLDWS
jgi:cytochrome P450